MQKPRIIPGFLFFLTIDFVSQRRNRHHRSPGDVKLPPAGVDGIRLLRYVVLRMEILHGSGVVD